ncbi:MAG TPA: ribonuclease domain-containing protein [Usitatibacter sp.]|nr:ribonuclease domain-containing protein [Usitatibacter sp.]
MSTRWLPALLVALLAALPAAAQHAAPLAPPAVEQASLAELPPEARQAVALIRKGGPYLYARDGVVFANRESLLPRQKRGYYREYTVKTPGVRTRGARRIIAGAGGEMYYTDDHYNHFVHIRE